MALITTDSTVVGSASTRLRSVLAEALLEAEAMVVAAAAMEVDVEVMVADKEEEVRF